MSPLELGEVTVTRVIEIDRSSFPTLSMLAASPADAIARHHHWLRPHFWDDRTGDLGSRVCTYVVNTPRHTVLIDTGVGNDKPRDGSPAWHMRRGAYLDDLRAAGVAPEQVDVVLCTHLHIDHVGWNTRSVGDRWVPTFPNARYVFGGEEWEFWRHEKDACIADSVVPVVEAGQAALVDADYARALHPRGRAPRRARAADRSSLAPQGATEEAQNRLPPGRGGVGQGEVRPREHREPHPGRRRRRPHRGDRAGRPRRRASELRHREHGRRAPRRARPAADPGPRGRRLRQHDEGVQHHARATAAGHTPLAAGRRRARDGASGAGVRLPPSLTPPHHASSAR